MLSRLRSAIDAFRGQQPLVSRSALWNAGATSNRQAAGWDTPNSDFAAASAPPQILRTRARHAVRNSAVAARGKAAILNNVIGAGIKPLFRTNDKASKKAFRLAWNRLVDSADFDGFRDLYALQADVLGHMATDGEVLVRRVIEGDRLKIQILPAEFLDSSITQLDSRVVSGVEFDAAGRRVAYHLFTHHPADPVRMPNSRRFPASEILHIRFTDMAGQVRGVSMFAPILEKLNNADQFDRATLTKAKISALWCAFRHGQPDANPLAATRDSDGTYTASLEPGTVQDIGTDEITFPPHADVAPYSEFMKTLNRSIASGLGIPYSTLTGDLSDTSYNSSRVGRIEFAKQVERLQWDFIFQFCRPVMTWWLEVEMLAGRLPIPENGIQDYLDVITWAPPPLAMLDPQRETDAKVRAIRAGLTSREQTLAESGYDLEDIDAQIAAGNETADRLKLVLDTDPRHVTLQGQQQSPTSGNLEAGSL